MSIHNLIVCFYFGGYFSFLQCELLYISLIGAGGAIMAMIIRRIATGLFHGQWSLLTTINGGLAGMVKIFFKYFALCDN